MKKYFGMLFLLSLTLFFAAGCTKKEAAAKSVSAPPSKESAPAGSAPVDVDLTVLSSTMVYGEVFNMVTKPEDYVGKTIKVNGPYYSSYYEESKKYYHYVIVQDATSCCQQGLEFQWNGKHTYPEDYPKEQSKVEMIGVYQSYQELGETYYYLAVNDIQTLT